jgi:pre-mRNA-processing factor SLU7
MKSIHTFHSTVSCSANCVRSRLTPRCSRHALVSQAPWYLNQKGPGLKHQRAQEEARKSSLSQWYERGTFVAEKATKFRKGACTNCGAMSHQKKDCVERPRAVGAWKTGKNIALDEAAQPNLELGFEGKRDRWNGFEAQSYKAVVDKFEAREAARAAVKQDAASKRLLADAKESAAVAAAAVDGASDTATTGTSATAAAAAAVAAGGDESDSDEDVRDTDFQDESNTVITQKRDPYAKTTSRNLRIREDTAKYLRNLDVNSAYYDP